MHKKSSAKCPQFVQVSTFLALPAISEHETINFNTKRPEYIYVNMYENGRYLRFVQLSVFKTVLLNCHLYAMLQLFILLTIFFKWRIRFDTYIPFYRFRYSFLWICFRKHSNICVFAASFRSTEMAHSVVIPLRGEHLSVYAVSTIPLLLM